MLLTYLQNNYQINEPIFVTDINLPVSKTNLRQMFKVLCDKGKITRFDKGVYYLKGRNDQNELTANKVVKHKYISNNKDVYGYVSGYTFANKLGLTNTFQLTIEITTNNTQAKYREITVKNLKVVLRKPKTAINENNVYILQLLDLLKDADLYIDKDIVNSAEIISLFIRKHKIRRVEFDKYINYYPEKVYRFIYDMKLYEALV